MIEKLFNKIFSTSAAGLYILIFAISIGYATFIENDYGTSSAQKMIFKSFWFELLLLLFGISLLVNIFRFRMIQQKKWAVLTFHVAIVVILIGSTVTRYFGSEGMMFIREGSTSQTFLSSNTYLKFEFTNKKGKIITANEPVLFASMGTNKFKKTYTIDNQKFAIELTKFTPNPKETLQKKSTGGPILTAVFAGENGREEFLIERFDKDPIYGTLFNFGNAEDSKAFNIKYEKGVLYFKSSKPFTQMVMATQTKDTLNPNIYHPLKLKSLYSDGTNEFVFSSFSPNAVSEMSSNSLKMTNSSLAALTFKTSLNGVEKDVIVYGGQGVEGPKAEIKLGKNQKCTVSYGAKKTVLPFSIHLRDFIIERYPGTQNASSYASEVTVADKRNAKNFEKRIYMNNILDYNGYRFFQTSFDKDEKGTQLSVNHDAWGTLISYFGYFLLTLGMVFTLFSKSSRFQQLSKGGKPIKKSKKVIMMFFLLSLFSFSNNAFCAPQESIMPEIALEHATKFGLVLVQDSQGRLKPMNTFANEVLRKLSRKETLFGQTPEQIILGMMSNPKEWYSAKMIKISNHDEVYKLLGVSSQMVSYLDFFDENGKYKLINAVIKASNTSPRERGVFDKEIIKIDEKVNICNMIYSGQFLKMFPDTKNLTGSWLSPNTENQPTKPEDVTIVDKFYVQYIGVLQNHNWDIADQIIDKVNQYQQDNGGVILPSKSKVKAEILLNKLNIFNSLTGYYGILSLLFLVLLFTKVFKPNFNLNKLSKITIGLLILCFATHTFGLGLRWYVSGRAPWSNGYESMIYIGWTTVLAGVLFSRKSFGALASTTLLASTIMMVAGLSYLDPEITPLVPVLKSYWLTIHVSLEAGSYGFLVLGAIIGVLNLIFMIFRNNQNKESVNRIIKELSQISEMTLIVGLFMISIGTYLGGVWANESWGRYWGWDAKETWALVTILVYSFILHMRFIPGLRGYYVFNVATLFGWASVAMTYFGVNYYLSGLHSYATGDPVPIPSFVYYILASLITISILAKWRERKFSKDGGKIG